MKKLFISFILLMLLAVTTSAEQIDSSIIEYTSEYINFYKVKTNDASYYLTDKEYNIILGPFKSVYSEYYDSWIHCINPDNSEILYDEELNELASVPAGGYICMPENGMYGLSKTNRSVDEIRDFQLFDLKTNELLSTPGYFVYYYLEEQNEKMAILKDGKYAIINKYGEYLTDFIFDEIKQRFSFRDMFPELYMIVVMDGEEKYLNWDLDVIDIDNYQGRHFITLWSDMNTLYKRDANFKIVYSKEKQAVYNSATQKLIVPFENGYTFKYHNSDGFTFTGENEEGFKGLFDNDGNLILDFEYESIAHTILPEIISVTKNGESMFYHLTRKEYIPNVYGEIVDKGLVIYTEYENRQIIGAPVGYGNKYMESVPISSRILNFAGHDIMGTEYKYVTYEGAVFMEDTDGDRKGDIPIDVNRNFAIINLNGDYLDFDGVIVEGRTMVPVREITEEFGGEVLWDGNQNLAIMKIDGQEVIITAESNEITVNGVSVMLDVPAKLINNKMMIPIRKLAELLRAEVDWDGVLKCVYIRR